jgi:hypothetical protein
MLDLRINGMKHTEDVWPDCVWQHHVALEDFLVLQALAGRTIGCCDVLALRNLQVKESSSEADCNNLNISESRSLPALGGELQGRRIHLGSCKRLMET